MTKSRVLLHSTGLWSPDLLAKSGIEGNQYHLRTRTQSQKGESSDGRGTGWLVCVFVFCLRGWKLRFHFIEL